MNILIVPGRNSDWKDMKSNHSEQCKMCNNSSKNIYDRYFKQNY